MECSVPTPRALLLWSASTKVDAWRMEDAARPMARLVRMVAASILTPRAELWLESQMAANGKCEVLNILGFTCLQLYP